MFDVVTVGFACLDVSTRGNIDEKIFTVDSTHMEDISIHPGGDAVNQAITARSLGLNAGLVSYVGDDVEGRLFRKMIEEKGLDSAGLEIIPDYRTMIAVPLISSSGQRNFLFHRGCSTRFSGKNIDLDYYLDTKALSIGSFFVASEFDTEGAEVLLSRAADKKVITLADTTYDSMGIGLKGIQQSLKHLDYFIPSLEEAEYLTGETECSAIADVFLNLGVKNVIIKMGVDGCYMHTGTEGKQIPTFPDAPIIDTTGCGDSFVSGFTWGLVNKQSPEDSALIGHAAASINAGYIGGSGHIRSLQQVLDFLKKHDVNINYETKEILKC